MDTARIPDPEVKSSPALTLLHLSDLHFGQQIAAKDNPALARFDQQLVTRCLLEDVKDLAKQGQKPDWILVTGDIAFSGQASEYALAKAWLEQVAKAVGLGLERVLLVPGNHDGDRKKATANFVSKNTHSSLRAAPLELNDLLQPDNASQLQTTLWPKLAAYADFAGAFGAPKLTPSSPFWTLQLDTAFAQPVYAIGLNSCLLSYDGEDAPSNLALGLGQLERAFHDIPPGALVLAMAHHPPEWLVDGVAGQHRDVGAAHALTTFLQKHPHILFVGHVHQQGGLVTHPLHTGGLLRFVAGAGHEAAHEGGRHAYAWVRLHGEGIDFYPRMWSAERQCFQPEANRFTLEKGEEYLRIRRVKLAVPLEKWLKPTRAASGKAVTAQPRKGPSLDPLSPVTWAKAVRYFLIQHSHIELQGIRGMEGAFRLPLERVYVELRADRAGTQASRGGERDATYRGGEENHYHPGREEGSEAPDRTLHLHEALARSPRAIFVGDPGSGKTTLLRFVTRVVAEGVLSGVPDGVLTGVLDGALTGGDAPAQRARSLLKLPDNAHLPFPLFTTLGDLDRYLRQCEGGSTHITGEQVKGFLCSVLERAGLTLTVPELQRVIDAGQLLVLLDAFDEIPGHRERHRAAMAVRELLACEPGLRVLMTSRTLAFEPEMQGVLSSLEPWRLQPMSGDELKRFLDVWFGALHHPDTERSLRVATELFEEIQRHPDIKRMATTPNIVTLIAILKHNDKKLPKRRVELYGAVINMFLELRDADKGLEDIWKLELGLSLDLSEKRRLLATLALEMHAGGEAGRTVPVKVPVRCFARQLLDGGLVPDETSAQAKAERLLDVLELRSGLLRKEGYGVQFRHIGFQEWLTALALSRERSDEVLWERLEPHVSDDWWNEVLRLLVAIQEDQSGPLLLKLANAGQGSQHGSRTDWKQAGRGIALALGGLNDLPSLHVSRRVEAEVKGKLELLVGKTTQVPIQDRVEALLALGRVGDPRLGLEKPENWIWIPPGDFMMGDNASAYGDEKPAHKVTFSHGFYACRFPVTNHDFTVFVKERGYRQRQWWSDEGWAFREKQNLIAPEMWESLGFSGPNQPVVSVNWYDAQAFCRWMNAHRHHLPLIVPGGEALGDIRLPTEAEWEYMARGTEGRRYPWGDQKPSPELANYDDVGLRKTSPVGAFPLGATPEGLLDMAGNVWEWVEDLYESNYKGAPNDGSPRTKSSVLSRVVRGSGWSYVSARLCAANRFLRDVAVRRGNVGFRVVRSVSRADPP